MQHNSLATFETRFKKPAPKAKSNARPNVRLVAGKPAPAFKASEEVVKTLVTQYMGYASSIAAKLARTFPDDVDFDEILCNARLGLLEAAKRFNPAMNVDFKTFSYYRIKGAVYDGLRKTGWIPRSLYAKMKFERAANEYMKEVERTNGTLSPDMQEFKDSVNSIASIYVMSMETIEDFDVEDDEAKRSIENRAEFQKIKEKVCMAIETLPDNVRKLIKMYYFQNKTMEEIGEMLNLSKSWASRLHAKGLELMHQKMAQLTEFANC